MTLKTVVSPLILMAIVALPLQPVMAADEYNTASGLTAAGAPLGLHGVDPVAFVTLGNRQAGIAQFTEVHDNVAYYFQNKENLTAFRKYPQAYLPQNGGYCTFGVSVGKNFDGDPRYADVVDGKLYVFLNEEIFNAYQQDKAGTIAKASKQWSTIRSKPVDAL